MCVAARGRGRAGVGREALQRGSTDGGAGSVVERAAGPSRLERGTSNIQALNVGGVGSSPLLLLFLAASRLPVAALAYWSSGNGE